MIEYTEPGRGTGRTSRQLAALPPGALYLVPSQALASYCRGLLHKMGRPLGSIIFVTPANFMRLEGAIVPAVDVDHAYWEATRRDPMARKAWDFIQCCVIPGR